jgi:hypothetical protein
MVVILKKFRVKIPYYDSGTRKNHSIEFTVEAENADAAVILAKKEFFSYEHFSSASWVRLISESEIRIREENS